MKFLRTSQNCVYGTRFIISESTVNYGTNIRQPECNKKQRVAKFHLCCYTMWAIKTKNHKILKLSQKGRKLQNLASIQSLTYQV